MKSQRVAYNLLPLTDLPKKVRCRWLSRGQTAGLAGVRRGILDWGFVVRIDEAVILKSGA
jgi:hypothetical protein